MEEIEWYQYDDLTQDWVFKRATIEALREIAEQLNKLNNTLSEVKKKMPHARQFTK